MDYGIFKEKVNALASKAGITANFSHEDGKHYAKCSDGTVIIANSIANSVQVEWGSGHMATAHI